jgi:hypothetical protein
MKSENNIIHFLYYYLYTVTLLYLNSFASFRIIVYVEEWTEEARQ